MLEITPHVSCLVEPHEFEDAVKMYSEVYVPSKNGYLKHVKMRNGRFARIAVGAMPKVQNMVEVEEELNFLPDGKIPNDFFDQIVNFFREVIKKTKMEYEAQAWILWSKETGYYISIPPQIVSKASVKFEYSKEALPEGHIICVCLHSHNSMGE